MASGERRTARTKGSPLLSANRNILFSEKQGILIDLLSGRAADDIPNCLAQLWSELQATQLVSAITFANELDAGERLAGQLLPGNCRLVPVRADIYTDVGWRASVLACVEAGFDPWLPLPAAGASLHLRLEDSRADQLLRRWEMPSSKEALNAGISGPTVGPAGISGLTAGRAWNRTGFECRRTKMGVEIVFIGPDAQGRQDGLRDAYLKRAEKSFPHLNCDA